MLPISIQPATSHLATRHPFARRPSFDTGFAGQISLNLFHLIALLLLLSCARTAYGSMQIDVTGAGTPSVVSSPTFEVSMENALYVEGINEGDVIAVGRTMVVRGTVAKGVIVLGGDCVVEGRVEGDVGSVGGSVIQREGSYIGGDVIALGGTYHHGRTAPGRNPASTTVMVAGYEDVLRDAFREPSSLLAPRLTLVYFVQRVLAVGFWFVVSLGLTWLAPGAVSRAAARLQLTSPHIAIIGFLSAVVLICGVSVMLRFLPGWLGAIVGAMAFILLAGAYIFGRVVVQAATGRLIQRLLRSRRDSSEVGALLAGAVFWVGVLSLPYVWSVMIFMLLIVSLGLTLTARYRVNWWRDA